jgi:hypothetical protein
MDDTFKKWVPVWDSMFVNDGKYRKSIIDDTVFFSHRAEQKRLDSINISILRSFLDKYGFPNTYQSGIKGRQTITFVMQHAPLEIQEKYYPMWVDAYKKNNITGYSLALLEDRINMERNRKQYYGTQHKTDGKKDYLYPVVNPDSINVWRKQMLNLFPTIEWEFENYYSKKWNIGDYKVQLPDLIKKFNVTDSPGIRFVKVN